MSNVLASIVNYKRQVVTNSKDLTPSLNSTRDFKKALINPDFGFIMECKKASPSKGLIRDNFDLSEIVPIYNQYADAISVLTEERFFQGSYRNLKYVSDNTDKPVLCKDFILEPKQIRQARYYGADAILLMLSVLSDQEYRVCKDEAQKYQMDVLTEVHDKHELERAIALKAEIIGINNRNLKNLQTSLEKTKTLSALVPKDTIIVTESGISSHQDVIEMSQYADACLVGSSLMAKEDLKAATSSLVYGDIKVCGLTSQQDLDLLEHSDASQLGVILAEQSKRQLKSDLVANTKPLIGVFQNQALDFVFDKIKQLDLSGIQLHGSEDDVYIKRLRDALGSDFFISKVVHVIDSIEHLDFNNLDEILLDSQIKQQQGGTGQAFDWKLLDNEQIKNNRAKIRIAGGLTSENLQALKQRGFTKLDICTGSELSPGIKCPQKLQSIFASSKLKGCVR